MTWNLEIFSPLLTDFAAHANGIGKAFAGVTQSDSLKSVFQSIGR
jgi:hypothetical protein